MAMILDMHVHTRVSRDATATVEEYCRALQAYRDFYPVDGFVVTEHRTIDRAIDYRKLGEQYGMLILQGVEVDGDFGHILLYGVSDEFLRHVDISDRRLKDHEVLRIIRDCGGIGVPAHPFRESLYGRALDGKQAWVSGVEVIEQFNGANTDEQNARASAIIARDGLHGIGGSDAHYVNWFLKCATAFERRVETMEELVAEIAAGRSRPIRLPQPTPWQGPGTQADGCGA
jgi:predicted metal-dependent phosphoesterase TrpH